MHLSLRLCFFALAPLVLGAGAARADAELMVCYNWGCSQKARVVFDVNDLASLRTLFDEVETPPLERSAIALAIGLLGQIAARQTPIGNDRGGNSLDAELEGRMDCIDHAFTTTQYLELMQDLALLRFHRVGEPVERAPLLFDAHFAAQIEEIASGARYAVDSWFRGTGEPAVILPLDRWKAGGGPDD